MTGSPSTPADSTAPCAGLGSERLLAVSSVSRHGTLHEWELCADGIYYSRCGRTWEKPENLQNTTEAIKRCRFCFPANIDSQTQPPSPISLNHANLDA